MYTPAQQAAIAIVATLTTYPPKVGFALLPVFCDGLEIGFVPQDQVDTLTEAAKASPAQPVLKFESAIRGGTTIGLAPAICHVADTTYGERKVISVTMDNFVVDVGIDDGAVSIEDMEGRYVHFQLGMADAIIAAIQTLRERAGS